MNHFAVQVEDMDELQEVYQRLKEHGATIDHLTDHGMTKSVYFFDSDGNRIEFFFNTTETAEAGLALMRVPGRKNIALVLEEVPVHKATSTPFPQRGWDFPLSSAPHTAPNNPCKSYPCPIDAIGPGCYSSAHSNRV